MCVYTDLSSMADSITEELEYKECGKEELDWGYEEGKDLSVCCRGMLGTAAMGWLSGAKG